MENENLSAVPITDSTEVSVAVITQLMKNLILGDAADGRLIFGASSPEKCANIRLKFLQYFDSDQPISEKILVPDNLT